MLYSRPQAVKRKISALLFQRLWKEVAGRMWDLEEIVEVNDYRPKSGHRESKLHF